MESTASLWIDREEPMETIPPPVNTRVQVLPLEKLSWENLERLCYRLAARLTDVADCRRYGIQGQEQQGIDVYVRRLSDGMYSTWQCKRYAEFHPSDVEKAVTKFLQHDWAKTSTVFHLAVTVSLAPTALANAVEEQAERCRSAGIEFIPLDSDRLSDWLKPHPDLIDDFFGRAWVEAFCGSEALQRLSGRRLTKQERIRAREKLRELYSTHFASVDLGLPAAASALRDAAPSFPLHDRYVVPFVESLQTTIELRTERSNAASNDESTGQPTSRSTEEDKSGPPSGFKIKEQRTKIDLYEWLAVVQRGVILGGPGFGKSAALRFLTLDLLSANPRREALARRWGSHVPLFVPFAMLTRLVANQEVVGIVDFLRGWLRKLTASEETVALIEQALDDERVLLLVDGLDEWTDSTAASTALVMILDFAIPRRMPVLATARLLGYERLGGLGADWKKAELLPFESKQQKEFTQAWFQHFHAATLPTPSSPEAIVAAAQRDTEGFMAEVEPDDALSELAGIPLLLSALILLRLQGRLLPRNRFEALEAITRTLIDEQPRRRAQASLQGTGSRGNPRLIERGIQCLALHIFQSPGSESVAETNARDALAMFYSGLEFRKSASEAIELATAQVERASHEVGILVQRQPEQVGFLHRSLQEFLAAKELSQHPFEQVKYFIVEKSAEPGWQEVLLAVLYLLRRPNEIDDILSAVRAAPSEPLEFPLRQIFLARSAFSGLNCSVSVAEKIAEEIFAIIETSTWMPLRRTLLAEAARGIDSEALGSHVRNRLKRWFPGRHRWRFGVFRRLAEMPRDGTDSMLYMALINADSAREQKEIAEAIALGAGVWPTLSTRLINLITSAANGDLLAAALHALAIGWSTLPEVPTLLTEASEARFDELKCVALIHRAKRGERTAQMKRQLAQFCRRNMHVYPWEDDLLNVLKDCWPNDSEFREVALESVRNRRVPTKWGDRTAFKYLIRSFPNDNDVAELLAETLREEERISIEFDHSEGWKWILAGFKGHPAIVPAAEAWLEKYGVESYDESSIGQLAVLAGTEKAKQVLLARLKGGKLYPQWVVGTLVDFGGANVPEIRDAFLSFIADEKRIATVANYLPDFLDKEDCAKRLLELLATTRGFELHHVLNGLCRVDLLQSPDALAIIERRLQDDAEGHFWWGAKGHLLQGYPQNPLVREQALKEFDRPDPSLSTIADVYAEDAQFRPVLEALIQPLHEDLRLTLVHSLHSFVLREDAFARDLVGSYSREWNGEVRTAAAIAYHRALRKIGGNHESQVLELLSALKATGPGYDERRQAAVAGLLVLGQETRLMAALVGEGNNGLGVRTYATDDRNWALANLIVEAWPALWKISGEAVWNTFREWDVLVLQLTRAGKRQLALTLPAHLVTEAQRQAHLDADVFNALSILREGQESFREFCVGLFAKMRYDEKKTHIGWGYNEVAVWFEAARYLAEHYSGDAALLARLEDIAQHSHEPSGPIIALCRGWSNSSVIEKIWNSTRTQNLNAMPATAWIVSVKATPQQFAEYVLSLPEALLRETWWRFPRETMRAIRRRLRSDSEAQRIILSSANASLSHDVVASVSRLLGTATRDRRALREWARGNVPRIRLAGRFQPMGYDMLSGQVRPAEFCLLEACLTS